MATISDIESAIVSWLSARNEERSNLLTEREQQEDEINSLPPLDPLLIAVQTIEGYAGQLDSEEALAQAWQKTPAFFVAYDGESLALKGQRLWRQVSISLLIMTTGYAAEELRRGSGRTPGLYTMIERGLRDLANQSFGLEIAPLQPISVTPLYRSGPLGGGLSLATIKFMTEFEVAAPPQPDVKCEEPIFVANWKVKNMKDFIEPIKPWETKPSKEA